SCHGADTVTLSPEAHHALNGNSSNNGSAFSGTQNALHGFHDARSLFNLFKAAPAEQEVAEDAHAIPEAGRLAKGLGPLGIVGGISQGFSATNELSNHQYVKGSLDAVQSVS